MVKNFRHRDEDSPAGGGRKLRISRDRMWVDLTVAGYNLVRLAKLAPSISRGGSALRPLPRGRTVLEWAAVDNQLLGRKLS